MARDYIRPDVPDSLYEELANGRVILINPEAEDIVEGLKTVQHRARERLLTENAVLEAWQRFQAEALPGVGLSEALDADTATA